MGGQVTRYPEEAVVADGSAAAMASAGSRAAGFRHEAMLYSGPEGFLAGTLPFIQEGVAAGEPTLVVVESEKIEELRDRLGPDAPAVQFADMGQVGRNPARIIPAWRQFVAAHVTGGRPLRGIGEPIGPARSSDELVECQRHETLLNLAFEGGARWQLLCPYDVTALEPAVIDEARRSHPFLGEERRGQTSAAYAGRERAVADFDEPLPEPPPEARSMGFTHGDLDAVRAFVWAAAAEGDLAPHHAADVVAAVNELATNSLRHGGGRGVVRTWHDGRSMICDVCDSGHIAWPLIGREPPVVDQHGGRGLWMVNQLCDLVQLRSSPTGTVVRVHRRSH